MKLPKKCKLIYRPKGRAGEYAKLALNVYRGCDHGCTYCYSPRILRRKREDFHFKVGKLNYHLAAFRCGCNIGPRGHQEALLHQA